MNYKVLVFPSAVADLDAAYSYAAKHAPMTAARWLERFQSAIDGLTVNPTAWPLAHESVRTKLALREMLFGKRPNVFRVVFEIVDAEVHVLRIRRGAQRWLTSTEVKRARSSRD